MTIYGVTPAGFVLKPVAQLVSDFNAKILGRVDPDLDLAADQPPGQIVGIQSEALGELWELLQVAFNATNRGDAEGALLDNIGGLTGTRRLGETPSSVPCNATFSVAGTYAKGALVAYLAPPASATYRFANAAPIVVPAVGDDTNPIGPAHPYTAQNVIFASTTDGPDAGDALIAANTVGGGPGHLNQRVPVAGWLTVADVGSANVGTLVEDEAPYRLRQVQDLAAPGSDTLDATEAAIRIALQNAGIVGASVKMYENTSWVFDPTTGLPPKSYLAVVYDADPAAGPATDANNTIIGNALWTNHPAGIQDFGTTSVVVSDSQGNPRTVWFTRPTKVLIELTVNIAVAPTMPAGVRATLRGSVAAAITNASQGKPFALYGSTFTPGAGAQTTLVPGVDFVRNAFRSIAQGQAGVLDVTVFTVTSPATEPSGNVLIDLNHLAKVHVITVTDSDFDPTA